MLNLNDIVALAKSGYKVDDIKELIKLSKEAETEESTPSGSEEEKEVDKKEEALPEEPKTGTVAKDDLQEETSKVIDYKKRSEELEEKLQELQKANTKKNMADKDETKSDLEVFADAMKSFM